MIEKLRIKPGTRVTLKDWDPADTFGHSRKAIAAELAELKETIVQRQAMLHADHRHAVLVIFQALDAGGKDGVIGHVLSGVNPQGCSVIGFKQPTAEELEHDYLWRIHRVIPAAGMIGIFNRSHYEDVLAVRVRDLVPETEWRARYEQINRFEQYLHENRVKILKFYLHISKKEQQRRLLERLLDPEKNWKFEPGDLVTREHWNAYTEAYEEALGRCSTEHAPWYVIPSDHKWFRNLAVAKILAEALKELPLHWPKPKAETKALVNLAKKTGKLPVEK